MPVALSTFINALLASSLSHSCSPRLGPYFTTLAGSGTRSHRSRCPCTHLTVPRLPSSTCQLCTLTPSSGCPPVLPVSSLDGNQPQNDRTFTVDRMRRILSRSYVQLSLTIDLRWVSAPIGNVAWTLSTGRLQSKHLGSCRICLKHRSPSSQYRRARPAPAANRLRKISR